MKRVLGILMIMVILSTSCKNPTSRSGQRAKEVSEIKSEVKSDVNIKVKVISLPEGILADNGLVVWKTKVMQSDSTASFVILVNKFDVGDQIEIHRNQRIAN
jgi:hypothetical protein